MRFGILKLGDIRFRISEISWVSYVMQALKDGNEWDVFLPNMYCMYLSFPHQK